ncbi:DUF4123 domain-containing protein [Shewanella sp. VB17]|uniref:DUF4123 domain-containing protein n=1 Tax=Shewanella sp. VB17 TaxID=2739432 RepID=UPI001566E4E1|nr:DUF4123 domain-containing protein [Shewanella sp. VB17]NRD71850.1 DUF4123 domain-containing protein [Shewanella sp. VB17]
MRNLMLSAETGTHWYVILNGTSDFSALQHFYRLGGNDAQPLWHGTAYADWLEVMPFIAAITPDSAFIDWINHEAHEDWGMLVSAKTPMSTVFEHFRSLTQIYLPSNKSVFFRFYDPRFGLPVADLCDEAQRSDLMGPTLQWVANGAVVNNALTAHHDWALANPPKAFPWWELPTEVYQQLANDGSALVINLLKDIDQVRPDLVAAYHEPILALKAQRFVAHYQGAKGSHLADFIVHIEQEQQRLGSD